LARARLDDYTPRYWVDGAGDDIPARANLLTAAMLTGAAEGALHDSVEFVKTRHQFGQPLGAFQAVKHRCADMAARAAAAWCLTVFATLLQQQADPHAAFQIAAAKMIATDAAVRNAAADIQNFGGMGFTGEQNPHLFLKRAHLLDRIGGDLAWTGRQFMTMPSSL
jgi:alkylation response protein AidB-like acyl-CoA dehydrogenase